MSHDVVSLASNLGFVDEMYARYCEDPASVDASWRALFSSGGLPAAARGGPTPEPRRAWSAAAGAAVEPAAGAPAAGPVPVVASEALSLWPLVNAYRVRGHLAADLDPLGLLERPPHPELEPATYGFREADMDRPMPAGGLYGVRVATPREVLARLRRAYCGSIGLEFMHISTPAKKAWLAERMETRPDPRTLPADRRIAMLERLVSTSAFERFVHRKYPGTKRFSLEGGESAIPLLDNVLDGAARLGAVEAVIGMAHRGRLCVLHDILQKPARDLFAEFDDVEPEVAFGGGDVKYHLGYSCDRVDREGRRMHLSLAFNPSHLEAVDPVVVGRVRAKQRRRHDADHARVAGILIHGDAAFAGQGLVPETLNLSNLHGYRTGGTVHIIINNQIGFTASPTESRSTPYCTDVAKMIQCPIWHVNGEDLDAVAQVVDMAMEYRAQFASDVVIDMFCYRKYGHNEMDEPSFTQPLMYKRIRGKKPVTELYAQQLIDEGVLSRADVDAMRARVEAALEREFEAARKAAHRPIIDAMGGVWEGYLGGADAAVPDVDTGVPRDVLERVAERATTVPDGFALNRKLQRLFEQRREMARGERAVDWAMAELLAFGSLLIDGVNVRLSGQDSSRGTFSQRHAVVTDQETGAEFTPLAHMTDSQGDFCVYDSPLSEAGVLGFEFGYSLDYPDALVMWEAQFGDFVNGAQVHLDVFISSCEDKWDRLSGLVMLLPHGFEGQGPEHSSARLERFLSACAEDNWQIVQPTTPVQYFHVLRRQVLRPLRKPLVLLTPKSLLRLPAATSSIDEFTAGRFQRVLADAAAPPAGEVDRVMVCTGKVFYDLDAERARREDRRTAIVRLEQLYPWRREEVEAAIGVFAGARELVWVQEEPRNMGAWAFVEPRLRALFPGCALRPVSRPESASPATGSHKAHAIEQERLILEAFEG
ncbi:MAG: 2-oxoglutarate dehydrogenase E1 component [Deltaproteobacteria bacterium]|nr:MAG: 2-oxoglutarate dehydrogenase E1 component [Deltaproteobacteria bacterium]